MRYSYCIIFVLVFVYPSYAIIINEVMYNPTGSDTDNEWIEVYNNDTETYNISGWKLNTGGTDHTLNEPPANGGAGSFLIMPGQYFIIAQDAYSFLKRYHYYNGTLIDSSWSDLRNSGNETIWLKNSSEIFDNITTILVSEGKSFCIVNSSFGACEPTPGYENVNYTTNDPILVTPYNETPRACDMSLEIKSDKTIYNLSTIYFDLIVNNTECNGTQNNFTINYYVEDVFGNFVKEPLNTTKSVVCYSAISRQWTPPNVAGSEAYNIVASILSADCNDTDTSNNNATKTIVVKGNYLPDKSSITILSVSAGPDGSVKYGEAFDVEMLVYRGNTDKYAIDVWVNGSGARLSETSTVHAKSRLTEYRMKIPVQTKNNCNGNFADGTFDVVAEGLGLAARSEVKIIGTDVSTCKTITINSGGSGGGGSSTSIASSTSDGIKFPHEIIEYTQNVTAGSEFSTSVSITNNFTTKKDFTLYSYAYSGTNLVTLGFDEAAQEWKGGYTANIKKVTLTPSGSVNVTLRNMAEDDALPGSYNFKVRIKIDGTNNDIVKTIYITPATEEKKELSVASKNVPKENNSSNRQMSNTGKNSSTVETPKVTAMVSGGHGIDIARYLRHVRIPQLEILAALLYLVRG